MDAATTRLTSKHLLLIAALIAAPAAAQAQAVLQVSANSVALGAQAVMVTVSSSQGVATPLSFTTAVNYGNGQQGWFNVAASQQITQTSVNSSPTTITIGLSLTPGAITTSGSIILTDTTNPSDPGQTITVNYSANGGGGGTTSLTATPSTVSMSVSPNSSTGATTAIQLTTSSPTVVSGNIQLLNNSAGSFLTLSTSNFSVSSSSPFQFSINGAPFTTVGNYSATIQITPSVGATLTIPVTYTSVTGTSASPNSVNLSYPSGTQSAQVTVSASSGSFFAQASSTNGWLLVNGASGTGFLPSGTQISLSVNTNVAFSLPTGSYSGQVTVQGSDGTQAIISANLSVNGASSGGSVNISPSSVTLSNIPVGSSEQISTVNLTTSLSNVFYQAAVSNNAANWLSLNQYSGTLSPGVNNPLTLFIFPAGLSAGTYTATVSLVYSGGFSSSSQIPVTLNVGTNGNGNGNGGNGQVYPTSLTFWSQIGGGAQNTTSSILVNSTGTWTATATTNTSQNWLSVGSSGTAPSQQVSVSVAAGALTAGTYSGSISITSNGGTVSVPVTLTVTNSMVATTAPGAYLVAPYNSGDPNPQTGVYVYASDGSSQPVTASTTTSWITISSPNPNPTTVASYSMVINAAGLPNGLNTGSVTFSVSNAADTTWTLPVAIIVNGSSSGGSGPLSFNPTSLAFNAAVNGTVQSQTLFVSSSSASFFSVVANSSGGWLSVSPTSSGLPANLTVTANPAGLSGPGYQGSLTFTANGISQTVPVSFSVGSGTGGNSNLTATPSSLSFTYASGGATPASQSITVGSANGVAGFYSASATTSGGGQWLSVSPTTNQNTGTSVSVSISPSGLAAGTYNGTITLLNPTTSGTLGVPVTLTVTTAPAITASPTTLSFSYQAGGTTPASQSVSVSGSGNFTATATSSGNWLSATPSSGTSPATVTVSVNPAGLGAGTYNGSVAIAGSGGSTGSTTVSVSLVVTAPLPTITQISNAGSYTSGAISPGEVITIFGTAIGPTTPVTLALTGTGTVSTNIGNVQVLVNGIPSPMIYASSTQVSAVVPYAISIFQTAQVYITFLGQSSNAVQETVSTTAPGIFTANSSGTGPGAILNQNLSVNSPANPAAKGSIVTLYLTGEGQTSPAGITGSVTQALAAPPYTPAPLLPVAVLIDGMPATIEFAGEAPGIVAGVLQINVMIPANVPTGAQSVQVMIGGRPSQAGVTVSVQ